MLAIKEFFASNGCGQSLAGGDDLPNNSGSSGDLHFAHHQPEKSLHRVGADVHSLRDFFAGHTLEQESKSLRLSRRQPELLSDFLQIYQVTFSTFQ